MPATDATDTEEPGSDPQPPSERVRLMRLLLRGMWRPLAIIAIIALIIVIIEPGRLVIELGELREWFRSQGFSGVVLFIGMYVLAAVAIVPQAALKVAAGGVYGAVLGVVVASIGATLGATACFLIARYVGKGSLMDYVRQKRQFRRLDILTRRHGAIIVAMTRLVPILPGNLVNYAFGLTQVRLGTFVFWSWLGMLPGTVVLVVGTDAFIRGVEEGRVPWAMLIVVLCALFLLAGAFFFVNRHFRHVSSDPTADADFVDL